MVTYNLYWWCVSDEYGNCPQYAAGKGFQQLYSRLRENGPFDLIGFQECDDVGLVGEMQADFSKNNKTKNPTSGKRAGRPILFFCWFCLCLTSTVLAWSHSVAGKIVGGTSLSPSFKFFTPPKGGSFMDEWESRVDE